MTKPTFTLITGAVNETTELEKLISIVYETCNLKDIGEFIIVYSKKSPSDYPVFLERLRKKFPLLNFVFMQQTGNGLSNAVFEGYNNVRFSHIIGFAADGNNSPQDIHKIMDYSLKNPEKIITASRRLHKNGFNAYSFPKKIANDIFYHFLRIFFRCRQSDITYFFECLPTEIFKKYCAHDDEKNIVSHICIIPELYDVDFIEFPSELNENCIDKHTNLGLKYYLATIHGIISPLLKKSVKKRCKK